MKTDRITNENGTVSLPQSSKPETMAELLDSASTEWKLGKKNDAFMKVLNALAMISVGTAMAMKAVDEMKAKLEPPKEDERPAPKPE